MNFGRNDDVRDVVKEFLFNASDKKFEVFVKNLVDKIAEGKIDPLEAYNEFFKKCEELFPESSNNMMLRESMVQRFQLYLQIRILAKLKRGRTSKKKSR